jgi:hypothetical protein
MALSLDLEVVSGLELDCGNPHPVSSLHQKLDVDSSSRFLLQCPLLCGSDLIPIPLSSFFLPFHASNHLPSLRLPISRSKK